MVDWIIHVVGAAGYWGIGLLMFVENAVMVVPSEVIMPLGGFASARGELNFWGVVAAGTVGSIVGQYPLYYLGYAVGHDRLRRLADKYGKWLTISGREVDAAADWFDRWGGAAVFFGRFVPAVRTLISLPAGARRMNLWKFSLYSFVGMGLWALLLTYLGRLLGKNWQKINDVMGPVGLAVVGLIVAGLIGIIVWRKIRGWGPAEED